MGLNKLLELQEQTKKIEEEQDSQSDNEEPSPKYQDVSQIIRNSFKSKEDFIQVVRNKGSNSFFFRSSSEQEAKANSLFQKSESLKANSNEQIRQKCQSVQFNFKSYERKKENQQIIEENEGPEDVSDNRKGIKQTSPMKFKSQKTIYKVSDLGTEDPKQNRSTKYDNSNFDGNDTRLLQSNNLQNQLGQLSYENLGV